MNINELYTEGWNSIAQIDIDAILHNLNVLKDRSGGESVKQMAVVKANAYGHGAIEVALGVSEHVDWFGVANVQEGVALRHCGIMKPIMVFGSPFTQSAHFYTEYGLTAVVSALEHFDRLMPGTKYHIKFDTGMGRLGIFPYQIDDVFRAIDKRNDIILGGIMTHFASAEEEDVRVYESQYAVFNNLRQQFGQGLLFHAANSAASLHRANIGFDMIRSGVAMYGFDPKGSYNPALRPALTWVSRLAQVRFMRKGEGISYSHSFHVPEDGWVGVIPVGYADGLPRRLRNRINVSIDDKLYQQVGNVTMDQIMIWLGPDHLPVDKAVLLMGGTNEISVYRWAELLGTIPYEVTTAIGNRVKRAVVKLTF
jgi:alanine racemase